MNAKDLLSKIVDAVFNAGVDAGIELEKKDNEHDKRIKAASMLENFADIERGVFEGKTREEWEEHRRKSAVAHVLSSDWR
jgi:hypothetical protein